MRLSVLIISSFFFVAFACSSCDKGTYFPASACDCDIEQLTLSESSVVSYQVSADAGATVSSITYQTTAEEITVNNPQLPFKAIVKLEEGQTVSLKAIGNPKNGNIKLTYETRERTSPTNESSSSVSRVWILTNDTCQ